MKEKEKTQYDCRVLVVEDFPDAQRLIAFFLKRLGVQTFSALNGKVAVEYALEAENKGTPLDMILMDILMPVMDGYEATIKLREADYTGPIIAVTAHEKDYSREKCIQAGCDDFISKPVDFQKLSEVVSKYCIQRHMETECVSE